MNYRRHSLKYRRDIPVKRVIAIEDDHHDDTIDLDFSKYVNEKGFFSIPPKTQKNITQCLQARKKTKQFSRLLRKKWKSSFEGEQINTKQSSYKEQATKNRNIA